MFTVEDFEKFNEERETSAKEIYSVKSTLPLRDAMLYQEQQTASDKALNLGKSLYNGYMSVPRGVLRGLQAVRDYNEVMLNEEAPDRMQADDGFKSVLDEAANAEFLRPYNVRADSSAERFVYDLAQGAGQLGGQATVGVLTGGYGTLPAMALQIGGEEYKELRDAGVDVKTAAEAGAFNAAVQTPLEYIGFSKLMKRFPGNTMLRQRVRKVAEDVFTEGFTEFLQEFPEQASKIWAENADGTEKDTAQIAREIFQTMWDHAGEILPGATYSGVIGGLLGGGAGSLHLALDNRMERSVERAMQREVYNEMTEHVESTVNRIKESGENPARAAVIINGNMQNQNVYVDGEALYGYAQEKGIAKVAESLGVSVEDIEKAAADSDTVDIKLGNYEATGAAFDGFLDAVKDDTAFEDGGYTVNKDKTEQAWAAAKKQQDDAVRAELDRIEGEMKEAAKAAGVKADVTREMINLLSRARMWNNPAEVLKKLSIRYGENAEGYAQFAGENAETADKVKLAEAQQMEENGAAADEIYKKTGWFKGLDNKWRFEIKDNLNDVDLSGLKKLGELPLARVYYNADLFDAYPILRTVKVNIDPNMEDQTYGQADVFDLVITLNENHLDEERMPSTVVHEIAHMIQKIEGFAAGGSAEDVRDALKTLGRYKQEYDSLDDYDLYLRIGGEQEAREVMRRARLEQYIARAQERYEEAKKNGNDEEIRRKLFAKTMLERKRDLKPTPHTSDAVIVFDGEDMPYAYDIKSDFFDAAKSLFQIVWHGSPHKFVKFDLGAIGTGEGAQAHGWGLYFAQDRKVAERYKDYLSESNVLLDGKMLPEVTSDEFTNLPATVQRAALEILLQNGDLQKAISHHKQIVEGYENDPDSSESFKRELRGAQHILESGRMAGTKGSLFQVEIPDNDVLLDEQKKWRSQPKKVREGIKRLVAELSDEEASRDGGRENILDSLMNDPGGRGYFIYHRLASILGGEKEASLRLNQYGVEGITYEGGRDGRCYVVFDDKAINIIDTYNKQVNGTTKGNYNPNTNIITLFKGADASTVIHETWHFFVEQMWQTVQDGTASEQTVKDFETLLNYAGMTMEEWAAADVDGRRKAHEKLAEAGETYIMEGNAPSHELRRVFKKFAQWLRDVYRTLQRSENYAELTDEVREVFDRMLAAEDDIAEMERINGYFAKLPNVITENMSDETRAKVEDYIAKAREKAVYILTRRALKDYSKKRREEVKKFKEEIRPRVEEEVSKRPVYACEYDKADAARVRMLRDQQAGIGIWTADDFIDRAFASDVSEVQNEVAHLAAAMNPKNWKKGLSDLRADYVKQRDAILQPAIDVLTKGMGQGVDIVQQEDRDGRGVRVSNNAKWYRDFYAEHKRKPNKKELQEMARLMVSGDANAPQVEGWTATSADVAQAMAEEGERLADIERHIEACEEIKDRLGRLNENYNETSAAGSERFLLEANMTAERYGYSSADEMMQDIEQSPTQAKAVNQRINEIVAEMSTENEKKNYENAIRESLYNEDEALLIGVEQQLIEEYAKKANERQEAQEQKKAERKEQAKVNAEVAAARKQQAKNLARADLAKMNVKQATRTSKFITAERNAAVKSAQLLAKKKYDEALTQKNLQAYWHAMAAESIKIARRQKQYEKFIKKQVKLKPEAWLNETHFAAISKLFERMNIARPVHRQAAENAQFETLDAYAAAMEEQFDCVDIAPWILDGTIPIDDTNALTLEQYEDVVNAIKNIKAIVRAQKGVNTFNKQETWANTKALMMEKLSELKTIWAPNPNKPTKATNMERFTASMETLDSFLEYLDDAAYGWFSQTWGNTIKRASDKEYEYKAQYDKADADALKKWLPDEAAEKAANEEIYYDELGNSVTKHTLVKMLIHLGNKENSQRLCETIPVGFEKSTLWIMPDELTDRQTAAEQTRQNLIDFLGRVLTKEDVEYAQRKIDAAEMFWGEKNELEKRVKGFGLKKVEATPVELEIDGEPVVLRGGYFPLMRNGETGSHSANAEVNDTDPLQGRNIRTYHTNTSATKARTNARYQVNLFPGAETQWIYESIHDLCWRETMNDFRRVLNDQELFAMLKSKVGVARMQVFKEMLEVAADPQGNSKSMNEFEKLFGDQLNWLRQRTSHAVIMMNLKVIAQNYANALLYGNAIEGYTMADNLRALGTYMLKYHLPESHKEMVDFVFSKSAFLRERCELPDITVRDIVDEKKEFAWEKFFREVGIKAMAMTDNATAIPNWLTAYNKKINEGRTEQEAIDYADALVRRVLGSSRITEVSSMQRARAYKVFTMFQSFFNARYNEFLRMERLTSKQWTQGQKQEAFANVCSYVVYKWLGQTMLAMVLALQNPFGIDDEDKWPEIIKELKGYSFSMMGPVGLIGNALAGSVAGMHEYTYRMSAIESTVENVNRSIKRIHSDKATTQDKAEGILNTATMLVGVPSQLNRIFWNTVDIFLNGMSPEIGDIMRRRPKNERR